MVDEIHKFGYFTTLFKADHFSFFFLGGGREGVTEISKIIIFVKDSNCYKHSTSYRSAIALGNTRRTDQEHTGLS